jgi:hypothetical protein
MEMFMKEASFYGVTLDKMYLSSPDLKKNLHDIMTQGITSGAVQPLPRTVFLSTEVEQAFRYGFHDGNKTTAAAATTTTTTTTRIKP